jgi:SAM-dependent methyltransferase
VPNVEWGAGRYERIADQILPAAKFVVARAAPRDGEHVVDVGCGTGNAALLAAERGARVTGVDPAQRLLDVAAAEAAERRLNATFVLGEAASVPLSDGSADAVISVFGSIFAPDPQAAAAEMARITAPDGRIVQSAWIPAGPIFDAIKARRALVSQATGEPPRPQPFPWHDADALSELFGPHGFDVRLEEQTIAFESTSAREFAEGEFEFHPMWVAIRDKLGRERAAEVRDRGLAIYDEANEDPSGFRVSSRYVVATITRPA